MQQGELPYALALVDLEEHPQVPLMTNIVDCALDELDIDQLVEVTFEERRRRPIAHDPVGRRVSSRLGSRPVNGV